MNVEPPVDPSNGGHQSDAARQDHSSYQIASQHWAHAEQIRWTLLYNLLVANTILLLAWVSLFVAQPGSGATPIILIALCATGLLISSVWAFLAHRANGFVDMYAKVARAWETPAAERLPFTAAIAYRQSLHGLSAFIRTGRVVIGVPLLFTLMYLVLGALSIRAAVRHTDATAVIEIRDVTMEKGMALISGNAEWKIRATVLSHTPSLQNGSALIYLALDVAGESSRKTDPINFRYTTVWLTNGTGVFVVNTVGPSDHAPILTWEVLGYTAVAPATLGEPAK